MSVQEQHIHVLVLDAKKSETNASDLANLSNHTEK